MFFLKILFSSSLQLYTFHMTNNIWPWTLVENEILWLQMMSCIKMDEKNLKIFNPIENVKYVKTFKNILKCKPEKLWKMSYYMLKCIFSKNNCSKIVIWNVKMHLSK